MNAVSGRAEPDQKELEDIVAMVLDYARQNDVDQADHRVVVPVSLAREPAVELSLIQISEPKRRNAI